MRFTPRWSLAALALLLAALWALPALAAGAPRISIDELKSKLGSVVVIDVRTGNDWRGSGQKIKGAVRKEYLNTEEWAAGLDQGATYVTYCA